MVKMTFTFDEATVERLRRSAERLRKPQSAVVREAIEAYANQLGRLTAEERLRLLEAFDARVPAIPARPRSEVAAEQRAVRRARRQGGRQHRTDAS